MAPVAPPTTVSRAKPQRPCLCRSPLAVTVGCTNPCSPSYGLRRVPAIPRDAIPTPPLLNRRDRVGDTTVSCVNPSSTPPSSRPAAVSSAAPPPSSTAPSFPAGHRQLCEPAALATPPSLPGQPPSVVRPHVSVSPPSSRAATVSCGNPRPQLRCHGRPPPACSASTVPRNSEFASLRMPSAHTVPCFEGNYVPPVSHPT